MWLLHMKLYACMHRKNVSSFVFKAEPVTVYNTLVCLMRTVMPYRTILLCNMNS